MKRFIQTTAAVFAALTISAGFAAAEEAKVINDTCPLKGKEVDGSKAVEYTAKFCCTKCAAKFEKEPLKHAAKVAEAKEGECPFSGNEVSEDAAVTVKIAVCCGGCVKKVSKDPAKYLGEMAEEAKEKE